MLISNAIPTTLAGAGLAFGVPAGAGLTLDAPDGTATLLAVPSLQQYEHSLVKQLSDDALLAQQLKPEPLKRKLELI